MIQEGSLSETSGLLEWSDYWSNSFQTSKLEASCKENIKDIKCNIVCWKFEYWSNDTDKKVWVYIISSEANGTMCFHVYPIIVYMLFMDLAIAKSGMYYYLV